MSDICDKCGLPKDICICDTIAKEKQVIKIYTSRRRYRKFITIVEGLDKSVDSKQILKELKTKLACGGTLKDNTIELQGNHKGKVKPLLMKMGFSNEQIEVS